MRRERDEKRSDTTSKDSVVCWRRSITLVLNSLGVNVKRDIIISMFYGMGIIDLFFKSCNDTEDQEISLLGTHCRDTV